MAEIFSGRLRIQFLTDGTVDLRVIGNNAERGVADSLDDVGRIEQFLKQHHIPHDAQQRRYDGGRRTDAVVLFLARRRDPRRGERRRAVTRRNA